MSLIEELKETGRQRVAEGIKKDGREGAYYRLIALLDPNKMADWLHDEATRAVAPTPKDLLDAIGQVIGMQLIIASGIGGKNPLMRLAAIELAKESASDYLTQCFSGEHKLGMVVSNVDRTVQVEATGEGLLRSGNLGIYK